MSASGIDADGADAALSTALEVTSEGLLVLDRHDRIVRANASFARMWRLPVAVSCGSDFESVLDAMCAQFASPAQARADFEQSLASRTAERLDTLELGDGRVFEWMRRRWGGASGAGVVLCFRDVTAVVRAREDRLEEARVFELLRETGEALSSKLDLESLVQAVTDAATKAAGAEYGAFFYNQFDEGGGSYLLYTLSGAPREAFQALGQPRPTELFGPTFRGGPPIRCDDVLLDARYGKTGSGMPRGHLPVRSYLAVSVVSRSGEVIGGLFFGHSQVGMFSERSERVVVAIAAQAAVGIDNARLYDAAWRAAADRQQLLSRERAARAEAERMSELKDEFLANLSHELRTPLNAILGWAQMLRLGRRGEADLAKGLETIERNARAQAQLVEDLLDMSRILSGKLRLDVQPVEPASFIQAAIDTVRPSAAAKDIRLDSVLDGTAGPVSGDPGRLQQVMWNLLSNAVKFTPRGGKVQVLLQRVNSHVEVSVTDTGVGIDTAFLPFVFDRFRQADASTTRRHGGLGLGLSIVKHLVELHGGSVRVASLGEGAGATFSVQLPIMVVHHAGHSHRRRHPAAPEPLATEFGRLDLRGARVLVVDDEPDAREMLERVLTECQAEVLVAASADEALQSIQRHPPDVLVSDIGMPDVDGYELLRRVRKLERARGGRMPAVALTAFARSEDRTRALRTGFLMHIAKPVDPSELVASIASILGRTGPLD